MRFSGNRWHDSILFMMGIDLSYRLSGLSLVTRVRVFPTPSPTY